MFLAKTTYILRWEDLRGNGSSPQGLQPILRLNFSRFKLYAAKTWLNSPTGVSHFRKYTLGRALNPYFFVRHQDVSAKVGCSPLLPKGRRVYKRF